MKAGLLGKKLPHSFSPEIHAMLGSYSYTLFEREEDELAAFLTEEPFDGINVTIPYKKAVIPYLDALSPRAQSLGSVNTIIRRKDGTLYGDNTDYAGFLYLVQKSKIDVKGRKTLVLGTGGSSVIVQAAAKELGADPIITISRRGENNYTNLAKHADAEIIINTTPVGMYPKNGESPLSLDLFPNCRGVIDIIYNPAYTKLLYDAQCRQIPCANGLSMLVAQAKAASELFTGCSIDDRQIDRIVSAIEKKTKNIILIGMPGCGKTTVGKALARLTNRPFVDCDEEIVKQTGCSIPEIFAEQGEETFRRIETEVTARLAKESGLIIATGGGVVTKKRNEYPLRQNAFIFHLEREIAALDIKGRPLSQTNSLEKMAHERMPLYRRLADYTVTVDGGPETAKKICSLIGID
ncbi:MAG: AAA family ATPase [Clostridiales bacterium]|nr:AAA family ATPase [Clostridiales bacterium]